MFASKYKETKKMFTHLQAVICFMAVRASMPGIPVNNCFTLISLITFFHVLVFNTTLVKPVPLGLRLPSQRFNVLLSMTLLANN